ncbi:type II secretion system protein [Serratia proteamaculans]|uniref:Prepilin-type N-terminal cleavage/methylation domain-containing protein n=1 Tax=Serratia proteamaculans TaxID=28151 RepID=A0A5Q2VD92_SERPR|nr:type II secretion system protein [Serratia proteamaculans]QGH61999.1 prepilin-type N-terminal cleavage/methylation domain-containing protein [Serratia proteamaculans]
MSQRQGGFTLVEMMVTLSLLACLTTAALPLVEKYGQRQKEDELRVALRQIREAIDRYHQAGVDGKIDKAVDASGYPKDLQTLVAGVTDKSSPNKRKIYFLRRIPRDPMCDCAGTPDAETWRTRSYTAPPDDFNGGKDLYDIASSSSASGLNGVPYAQW